MDNDDAKIDPFAEGFGIEGDDADVPGKVEPAEVIDEEEDESLDVLAEKELADDDVEEEA